MSLWRWRGSWQVSGAKRRSVSIHTKWKVFKGAITDLIAMAKGANIRAESALKRATKMEEESRKREKEVEAATAQGVKLKKQKLSKSQEKDIFTICREISQGASEFPLVSASGDAKLCQTKLMEKKTFRHQVHQRAVGKAAGAGHRAGEHEVQVWEFMYTGYTGSWPKTFAARGSYSVLAVA